MNTKMISITIVFAALTIALNLSPIKIPAPYAPFLIYQIWEIPIVAVFLSCGPEAGVLISILNTAMLFAFFPGLLPTGPLYNFAAVLSMLLGIYIHYRFLTRVRSQKIFVRLAMLFFCSLIFGFLYYELIHFRLFTTINFALLFAFCFILFLWLETRMSFNLQHGITLAAFSTVLGTAFRVGVMTIINYSMLRYPPPIGYHLPEVAIIPMLPLIGLFNATLALYTIPIGHFLAKVVSLTTKIALKS